MDFADVHSCSVGRDRPLNFGTNQRNMKRSIILCALLAVVTVSQAIPRARTAASAPAAAQSGSVPAASSEQYRTMVTTYCAGCHNSTAKMGGLALDTKNLDAAPNDAATWEKAVRKLRGRLMPPPGAKQPEQKQSMRSWVSSNRSWTATQPCRKRATCRFSG